MSALSVTGRDAGLFQSIGVAVREELALVKDTLDPENSLFNAKAARAKLMSRMGAETGLSVSLFPMVIISMVIERMSIVWEERGAGTAIREGFGSLALAALTYLVMTIDVLAYWVTVFPEINLVVLGLIVALGRYTGLRLSELLRFRALAAEDVKP